MNINIHIFLCKIVICTAFAHLYGFNSICLNSSFELLDKAMSEIAHIRKVIPAINLRKLYKSQMLYALCSASEFDHCDHV